MGAVFKSRLGSAIMRRNHPAGASKRQQAIALPVRAGIENIALVRPIGPALVCQPLNRPSVPRPDGRGYFLTALRALLSELLRQVTDF
jgi:hypothetical protein